MKQKKFVNITYFTHSTSEHNEKKVLAGWYGTKLSELGKKQSLELRELIKDKNFDVIFCSDLKRAVETARIAFKEKDIIKDKRLRECNYGDFTGAPFSDLVIADSILKYVNKPFPNGESYKDVEKRMKSFLKDLLKNYPGKNVAIVSHRTPQLVLEVLLNGKTWKQAIEEDWRFKKPKIWQPGWGYRLVKH